MFAPPPPAPCLRRWLLVCGAVAAALHGPAHAQQLGAEAVPGSAEERYLRALQVSGAAPLHPWSLREFSPAEIDLLLPDSAHPWRGREGERGDGVRLLRPRLELGFNSAFAQGGADGAVWAGRGATASGSAGVEARWGVLSARVEPLAFWAQNRAYDVLPSALADSFPYADPYDPRYIDLPQRFGDEAYSRVDPGNSWVRLDVRGVAAGVSTAPQHWGPAIDQPLLLGPGAPGFTHAFLGTSHPWRVGIGRVHGRLSWGDLRQSPFSTVRGPASRRLMTGATAVFLPWGLDGVEIGVSRFFHVPRDSAGLSLDDYLTSVSGLFKASLPGGLGGQDDRSDLANQLASVSVRWTLPRAGAEVYAEYARDDHSWDLLDFFMEPDHSSAYMLGASRAWRRGRSLYSVRGEVVNSQISHVQEVRAQLPLYRHTRTRQGHTHRGQLLGSAAGYGGGGSVLALEAFTPRGRWSVDWTRTRVADNWGREAASGEEEGRMTDVVHSLGGEAVWFAGPVDVTARLRGGWELNRQFRGDAFNLNAALGLRLGL